jgi:hypothetical protein
MKSVKEFLIICGINISLCFAMTRFIDYKSNMSFKSIK